MKLRWVITIAVAAFAIVPGMRRLGPRLRFRRQDRLHEQGRRPGGHLLDERLRRTIRSTSAHDKTIAVRSTTCGPASSRPGGTFVAFERQYTTGGANLMVVRSDRDEAACVDPGAGLPASGTAIRAGLKDDVIIFAGDRDGNFDLYATPADGEGLLQLPHEGAVQDLGPTVSPNGNFVVFSRRAPVLPRPPGSTCSSWAAGP